MVSTRKKKQSNRKLLNQLDDFDQIIKIGNTKSDRRQNATLNEVTADQEFTVGTSGINLMTTENMVNVKTLERCFNESIDTELTNIVDAVEDRIQNAAFDLFW